VVKLNIGKNRRKLPWYEYASSMVGIIVGLQLVELLSGLGVLIVGAGAFAGAMAAFFLAYELAKWLSDRFPALKSEHVGYFDR